MFKLQTHGKFGEEALKLISDRLEGIASKKGQLTKYLAKLENQFSESIDAKESSEYIQEKLVAFENGFRKATAAQKKRLLRKTVKQLALTADGLAIWFYMSEDDEIPGRNLKLVRSEPEDPAFCLVEGETGLPSKQSVTSLEIRGVGDHGRDRTCDLRFRKPLLYPTELRDHFFWTK